MVVDVDVHARPLGDLGERAYPGRLPAVNEYEPPYTGQVYVLEAKDLVRVGKARKRFPEPFLNRA